jgi:hypothetical protein
MGRVETCQPRVRGTHKTLEVGILRHCRSPCELGMTQISEAEEQQRFENLPDALAKLGIEMWLPKGAALQISST